MADCQAVRTGFAAAFKRPALFAAEIAWRWAFGAATWLLLAYGILLFLRSVPVSDRDMLGLSGIIPGRFAATVLHILAGSGPKMLRVGLALLLGVTFLSWISTSLGRAAVLRSLLADASGRTVTLFRLNLLRAVCSLLVMLAYAGCAFLVAKAGTVDRTTPSDAKPDLSLLYAALACLLAWLWARLDSKLTLAGIFSLRREGTVLGSLVDAADVSLRRVRQFAWVGLVFGGMRFILMVGAFFAALMAFGMFTGLSTALSLLAVLGVIMAYSAVASFLTVGALAAQVRVIEWDATEHRIAAS